MNLRLKTVLLERGIRQIEMAKTINLDPSRLSKIVNGWLEPKAEEINAIAEFLGMPADEIFPKR